MDSWMDALAYFIGYAIIWIGAPMLALIILAALGWSAFEVIARRVGWTRKIAAMQRELSNLRRG